MKFEFLFLLLVPHPLPFSNCLSPTFGTKSERPVVTVVSFTNTTANVSWTVNGSLPTQCNDFVTSRLPLSFFVDLEIGSIDVDGYPMVMSFSLSLSLSLPHM